MVATSTCPTPRPDPSPASGREAYDGESPSTEWDSPPEHAEEVLSRAYTAIPALRTAAPAIEQQRRLPRDVVDLLRGVGVWRAAVPRELGGPELTSVEQVELLEILAQGDASAAWCAMIGMDSGIYSGYLDPGAARTFYSDIDVVTAGALFPTGRAERVRGGYRISGRWRFASGIDHSEVVVASCVVHADGAPEPDPLTGSPVHWRVMTGRPEQFRVHDTWFTTGLAGSGSRDYSVEDLFVPEEHSFTMARPRRGGPLLRTPDAVQRKMPGVPLGVARAALDHVIGIAGGRRDRETRTPWADDPRVHETIGRCEADLYSARAATYQALQVQWEALESSMEDLRQERIDAALTRYNAFQVARRIVATLYDLVGGTAVYRDESPLDRWLRDTLTMCQHAVAQNAVLQMAGVIRLGGQPPNPYNPALAESLPAI